MPVSDNSEYLEAISQHTRSLDVLISGSAEVCAEIAEDAARELDHLDLDVAPEAISRFEEIVETANVRLRINLEYRKSYAEDIFTRAAKEFPRHVSVYEQRVLANLRKLTRDHGPDHPSVRVLVGFSYPTQSQVAMSTALDAEVWLCLQETADKVGPHHPKIRSLLVTASSARAGAAMSAALDETVWRFVQETADELGPEHPKVRSVLAAASAPQSRAAMVAALNKKVWTNLRDVASQPGSTHHRVRQILGAASTPEVADVMLGLLHRQSDLGSLPRIADDFFVERAKRFVDQITQTAATRDPRSAWLTREDPDSVAAVVQLVRQIRREAAARGQTMTDAGVYLVFYRIADYETDIEGGEDGGTVRADRTRPFQILAALMGGTRSGKLPF